MRLIDADALMEEYRKIQMASLKMQHVCITDEAIDNAPTVDAVPVVRCKDCRHWCEMQNLTGACLRLCAIDGALWLGTDSTDYCSFAERKDNE